MDIAAMLEALGSQAGETEARRLLQQLEQAMASSGGDRAPAGWTRLAAALASAMLPRPGVEPAGVEPAGVEPPGVEPGPVPRLPGARRPLLIGISGAQGSGKTTLARALQAALGVAGVRALAMSLDDFYLPRSQRRQLAADVHPLLATRGVPGTHDLELLWQVLQALADRGSVAVPGFDKGLDERLPVSLWRRIEAPVDVVILDGWCLGIPPQPAAALELPCNDLEAREDPQGHWRRYVNAALGGPYARLWHRLDGLVFLRVPGMAAVARWRAQQEQALEPTRRMDAVALARFIAHYQRLTQWSLQRVPPGAGVVVELDDEHDVGNILTSSG
ncbi:MAG: hypothetical protein ACNA7W_09005 [Pseudomonadales bacterium]